MYALYGAADPTREALSAELSALGHSVVLVGDSTVAQVHVHLAEAGAAIEAALHEPLHALGGDAGLLLLMTPDGRIAEVARSIGYAPEAAASAARSSARTWALSASRPRRRASASRCADSPACSAEHRAWSAEDRACSAAARSRSAAVSVRSSNTSAERKPSRTSLAT